MYIDALENMPISIEFGNEIFRIVHNVSLAYSYSWSRRKMDTCSVRILCVIDMLI